MHRENLYQEFEIEYKELDSCPLRSHQHSYFELVYIISGVGQQCINKNCFEYHRGHLFLITPHDSHSFIVKETTGFFIIRFNNIAVKTQSANRSPIYEWSQRIEYILQNANHQPGCLLYNESDKPLIRSLIEAIIREKINEELNHKDILWQLVNTVISIVARNLAMKLPERISESNEAALDIIGHVQQHIYNPEKLKLENISNELGISHGYLSRYFKKYTGESLKQYILKYKLKLIESRLLHSDLRISEIVNEFGFTDESHLNRLFKKYKGINPSIFRKTKLIKPASDGHIISS